MADDADPPRKFYQLKPKEFERVNAPPPPATPEPSKSPPVDGVAPAGKIDVRELAHAATSNAPLLGTNAPANRVNEIHAMLQANLARENAAGLNTLAPLAKKRSRRRRDYWILLATVNTAIVAIYAAQIVLGFQVQCLAARMPFEFVNLLWFAVTTPQLYVIPALGMAFFTAGLTWVMFSVMDDY